MALVLSACSGVGFACEKPSSVRRLRSLIISESMLLMADGGSWQKVKNPPQKYGGWRSEKWRTSWWTKNIYIHININKTKDKK